ncbi:SOS response-associated peptidase [Mucilaginibacter sp. UYCu711]|uniref:SOS response-associated peptidase n=1 Tax=Mucilaginibacter sp. UYCu711 TaxID=3156339 RepID=UPI003D1FEDA8
MCARFTLSKAEKDILAAYAAEMIDPFNADTNIAPTDGGLVIRADKTNEIHNYHFGLVPWHAADTKTDYKGVNARNDNLLKGQWKTIMEKGKRCLVIADGFYEWENVDGEKLPWRFTLDEREIFAFAGLYDTWVHPTTKEAYRSFAIITTEPNSLLEKYHNRMPVILSKEEEQLWIAKDLPLKELVELCDPFPVEQMKAYRVSKAVNSTRVKGALNKGPELILPANSA